TQPTKVPRVRIFQLVRISCSFSLLFICQKLPSCNDSASQSFRSLSPLLRQAIPQTAAVLPGRCPRRRIPG
ncbi:MAG: hypothetical protein QGI77_07685, partial [Roseibacillus sp.]|nr:hypothetical protein [Roseibacillus sp.]